MSQGSTGHRNDSPPPRPRVDPREVEIAQLKARVAQLNRLMEELPRSPEERAERIGRHIGRGIQATLRHDAEAAADLRRARLGWPFRRWRGHTRAAAQLAKEYLDVGFMLIQRCVRAWAIEPGAWVCLLSPRHLNCAAASGGLGRRARRRTLRLAWAHWLSAARFSIGVLVDTSQLGLSPPSPPVPRRRARKPPARRRSVDRTIIRRISGLDRISSKGPRALPRRTARAASISTTRAAWGEPDLSDEDSEEDDGGAPSLSWGGGAVDMESGLADVEQFMSSSDSEPERPSRPPAVQLSPTATARAFSIL
eukprot:COSAG01_NODE_803_length_13459_cov_9.995808_7_plen_309_part_00